MKNMRLLRQKGYSLVEIAFGLAIFAIVGASAATAVYKENTRQDFEVLGNKMSEHSRAVAEWIVDQGGSAVAGSRVGTDWLKSNIDCGITTGGTIAYLPCGFDFDNYKYGSDPTTVISNSGGVTTAVTTWPAVTVGGQAMSSQVGHAIKQAEADSRDTLKGVVTYTENNAAVMTATIDLNNGTGIYVKRSGDTMTGALDMLSNDISNVGELTATDIVASRDVTVSRNLNVVGSGTFSGNLTGNNATFNQVDTTSLDTSGTANINALDGNLQILSIQNEGDACTGPGRIAVDTTGGPLYCQSGTWKSPAGGSSVAIESGTVAHGSAIPIPTGYSVSDCHFSVTPFNYRYYDGARNEPHWRYRNTYSWSLSGNVFSSPTGQSGHYVVFCQ